MTHALLMALQRAPRHDLARVFVPSGERRVRNVRMADASAVTGG